MTATDAEASAVTSTHAMPGVSVVVPVRNGATVLPACLEALANQDYPPAAYEVIVVDNGSTDASRQIAAEPRFRTRCLDERTLRTSYAARNAGISAAAHALIAFTDADCIAVPRWLRDSVAGFTDVTVGCVCGPIVCVPPRTWVQRYQARRGLLSQDETLHHRVRPYAQTANAVYRRAVFDAVGLFPATWISGGDADLGWRMSLETSFTLRYQPTAVVCHQHRAALLALLQQRFRHGIGKALLEHRYRAAAVEAARNNRAATFWRRPHRVHLLWRDVPLELLGVAAFHLGRLLTAARLRT